ncbi:hypothetical protein HYALB_00002536 [Hymenoscyphus albidus]|uniref:Uncharacterized protein n=1 Tax=Hymenoscyphus albidus TaxID=595503 RepID=A0A9N9LSP4_9HELO|nr:hypothetical protein HYALB_00002536 [Hymenoscyphus albidus]
MENSQQTQTQTQTTHKPDRGTPWNDFENALLLSYHFKKEALKETWSWLSKQMIRELNARGISTGRSYSTSSLHHHYHYHKDALYAVWGNDGVKANTFIAALDRTAPVSLRAQADEMVDDEPKNLYHWSDFEKALPLSYNVDRLSKEETWVWVAAQMNRESTQRGIPLPRVYSGKSIRQYLLRFQNVLYAEWGDDGVKADTFIDALDRTAPMPFLTESRRVRAERERGTPSTRRALHWSDFEKALLISLLSQQGTEEGIINWQALVAEWGDDGVKANAFIRAMDRTAPEPLPAGVMLGEDTGETLCRISDTLPWTTCRYKYRSKHPTTDTNQLDPGFEMMTPRSYKRLYDELHPSTQEPAPSPSFNLPIRFHDIPGPSQAQAQPTQEVGSAHPYGVTRELYMLERENQEILDKMGVTEEEFLEFLKRGKSG